MKKLVNINKDTTSFETTFNEVANEYANKLRFTTRMEYLVWREQWKMDFAIVERNYMKERYQSRINVCQRPEKIERYTKLLGDLKTLDAAEYAILNEIREKYIIDVNPWCKEIKYIGNRQLVYYMLVIRKAGKIRSKIEREKRLAEESAILK